MEIRAIGVYVLVSDFVPIAICRYKFTIFFFFCLLLIGIATKSGDFAEQSRFYFAVMTNSHFAELGKDWIIL
jgi:hypothetical protein